MTYHLRVYDNFHYTDEDEADSIGNYANYEEALVAAKYIVENFLISNWKKGISPEKLFNHYDNLGDDPAIIPDNLNGDVKHERFSARGYAKSIAQEICKRLEIENLDLQTAYQEAIKFATEKHLALDQKVPGTNLPYVVHLSNVAMEILVAGLNTPNFNTTFALQVALLHDTLEDTNTSYLELENKFGFEIAQAVSALTKNKDLPKDQQMQDSLNRIKMQKFEVWAVKLADRITNLQKPPLTWNNDKKTAYKEEAKLILRELNKDNDFLASRLETKINEYVNYFSC